MHYKDLFTSFPNRVLQFISSCELAGHTYCIMCSGTTVERERLEKSSCEPFLGGTLNNFLRPFSCILNLVKGFWPNKIVQDIEEEMVCCEILQ